MLRRTAPEVGCWYQEAEQGRLFEVVSLDEDENSVAIQYFEGEIEALELDAFMQMPLRIVEQPEDWSGPYELDPEDRMDEEYAHWDDSRNELRLLADDDSLHVLDED
ncbi:MAG: DUF6763 family protein [Gammaproteobacteria bacterium]